MKLLSGPVVALVTPFTRSGALNARMIPKLLRFLLDRGVRGVWACGTSSEVMSLDLEERKKIVEITVGETASQVPVVVHVGHPVTAVSVDLARHARRVGADAVAACVPYPPHPTFDAVLAHYQAISSAARLPFYVYMVNLIAPVQITVPMVRDIRRRMPVVGIKWTTTDVAAVERLSRIDRGRFNVVSGIDELLLACAAVGADGSVGIGHNALPETISAIHRLVSEQRLAEARALQSAYNDLVAAIPERVNFIARTKEFMRLRGFDVGPPRKATLPPDGPAAKKIAAALEKYMSRSVASKHFA